MMVSESLGTAYEDFIDSLDLNTRDAVTKLMIHTKTRPNDPQMVSVCLTALASVRNTAQQKHILETQKRTVAALEALQKSPDVEQNFHRVTSLEKIFTKYEYFIRQCVTIWGWGAALLAMLIFASMVIAWNMGYRWARADAQNAMHEQVCTDLYGSIASVGEYWRTSLHMSAAAERLTRISLRNCPR